MPKNHPTGMKNLTLQSDRKLRPRFYPARVLYQAMTCQLSRLYRLCHQKSIRSVNHFYQLKGCFLGIKPVKACINADSFEVIGIASLTCHRDSYQMFNLKQNVMKPKLKCLHWWWLLRWYSPHVRKKLSILVMREKAEVKAQVLSVEPNGLKKLTIQK